MSVPYKVSILGDSISTFDGYTQPGGVFYTPADAAHTGIPSAETTWWMKVIHSLGAVLLGNSSWSGSTVSRQGVAPAGSIHRLELLSPDGSSPQLILVYSGLNDVLWGISPQIFMQDYCQMLDKIGTLWPCAKIVCGTLLTGKLPQQNPNHPLPLSPQLPLYNQGIRSAVQQQGCYLADLALSSTGYQSIDGFHPDQLGMTQLAALWLDVLQDILK